LSDANLAESYGVRIEQIVGANWRATVVRHLSAFENQGGARVLVAAYVGTQRAADPRLRIGWTFAGRRPDEAIVPRSLNLLDGLGHGYVTLRPDHTLTVWLDGDGVSDRVTGLHTRHPAELTPTGEPFNTPGAHSFYIRFERVEPSVTALQLSAEAEVLARLARLEAAMDTLAGGWREKKGT